MAGERLARRLRTDVADVRVRLEEAALRSDALLATGQPERAAAVLDEQHALLAELRDTLSSTVAAAMVEAEAEAVLAGSPDGATLFGEPATAEVAEPRRSARSTASALVSAVAALALLIVAPPAPSPDTLSAADRRDGSGQLDGASTVGAADAVGADEPGVADEAGVVDERDGVTSDLEIDRLLGARPTPSGGDDAASDSGLSQFQALVDQFVATVVRAAGGLVPATLPILTDEVAPVAPTVRELDAAEVTERIVVQAPQDDRPAEEPAPADERRSEPPSDQPSEDDGEAEPGLELPSADGNAAVPGLTPFE